MTWVCGDCKAQLRESVPRCFYCDLQEIADLKATVAAQRVAIAERDKALAQWASVFAPKRPLGVQFPPMPLGAAS